MSSIFLLEAVRGYPIIHGAVSDLVERGSRQHRPGQPPLFSRPLQLMERTVPPLSSATQHMVANDMQMLGPRHVQHPSNVVLNLAYDAPQLAHDALRFLVDAMSAYRPSGLKLPPPGGTKSVQEFGVWVAMKESLVSSASDPHTRLYRVSLIVPEERASPERACHFQMIAHPDEAVFALEVYRFSDHPLMTIADPSIFEDTEMGDGYRDFSHTVDIDLSSPRLLS